MPITNDVSTFSTGAIRNYQIQQQLQIGGSSIVYVARDTNKNVQVAIKLLPIRNAKEKKRFIHERNITSRLSAKQFSISLYDHFMEGEWGFLVMELLQCDLLRYFQEKKMSLNTLKYFMYHICKSIEACHRRNIVHLDIKPENILLDNRLLPVICDYGCAKKIGSLVHSLRAGTVHYKAPEYFTECGVAPSGDIWSIGAMLYSLSTAQFFPNQSVNSDFLLLPEHLPDQISDTLKDLICNILKFNPSERPTIETILSHPWFSNNE